MGSIPMLYESVDDWQERQDRATHYHVYEVHKKLEALNAQRAQYKPKRFSRFKGEAKEWDAYMAAVTMVGLRATHFTTSITNNIQQGRSRSIATDILFKAGVVATPTGPRTARAVDLDAAMRFIRICEGLDEA